MKGQYVADLKIGDEIRETFILNKKNVRQKRGGGYFATLELSDRTGHIEGIMWDGAEEMNRLVHSGDFVFVTGAIGEYNGRPRSMLRRSNAFPRRRSTRLISCRQPSIVLRRCMGNWSTSAKMS